MNVADKGPGIPEDDSNRFLKNSIEVLSKGTTLRGLVWDWQSPGRSCMPMAAIFG